MGAAVISIAGYEICRIHGGYRRWHFVRNDRSIRNRVQMPRSGSDSASSGNDHTANLTPEYLYVTTAADLRQRIENLGYSRESLMLEFQEIKRRDFQSDSRRKSERARNQTSYTSGNLMFATLEDWLVALKTAARLPEVGPENGVSRVYQTSDDLIDVEDLIRYMTDPRFAVARGDVEPRHTSGFPCKTLESMALAVLDMVPNDAECVLDVTALVNDSHVYCFEDLLLA